MTQDTLKERLREPSAAEFHSFWPLEEHSFERGQQGCRLVAEHGAQFFRMTVVSEEHPRPPYPHGIWLEGWRDKLAVPIEFGSANPVDGTISPPLTTGEDSHG